MTESIKTCEGERSATSEMCTHPLCPLRAISAIVQNGDRAPVCPHHAEVARYVGWKVGPLKPRN